MYDVAAADCRCTYGIIREGFFILLLYYYIPPPPLYLAGG